MGKIYTKNNKIKNSRIKRTGNKSKIPLFFLFFLYDQEWGGREMGKETFNRMA